MAAGRESHPAATAVTPLMARAGLAGLAGSRRPLLPHRSTCAPEGGHPVGEDHLPGQRSAVVRCRSGCARLLEPPNQLSKAGFHGRDVKTKP